MDLLRLLFAVAAVGGTLFFPALGLAELAFQLLDLPPQLGDVGPDDDCARWRAVLRKKEARGMGGVGGEF